MFEFKFNEDFDPESNDFVRVLYFLEMKNSVGVNRGHCEDCGVDESSDYKIKKNTDVCRYCGCYPVKYACDKIMQAKKQSKDLVSAVADLDKI